MSKPLIIGECEYCFEKSRFIRKDLPNKTLIGDITLDLCDAQKKIIMNKTITTSKQYDHIPTQDDVDSFNDELTAFFKAKREEFSGYVEN